MGAAEVWEGVAYADKFFMNEAPVHRALRKLVAALDELQIPYALVGAMALNAYGYRRVTEDVDILLTAENLARFKAAWIGRGYIDKFPGSRAMRDTENNVAIDVLITGGFPGDGQPKPVRFPDPATVAVRDGDLSLLPLPRLVELKLASGISNIHRAKDLGDVVELVKHVTLPRELGDQLDASVRDKYFEIWDALQIPDPLDE